MKFMFLTLLFVNSAMWCAENEQAAFIDSDLLALRISCSIGIHASVFDTKIIKNIQYEPGNSDIKYLLKRAVMAAHIIPYMGEFNSVIHFKNFTDNEISDCKIVDGGVFVAVLVQRGSDLLISILYTGNYDTLQGVRLLRNNEYIKILKKETDLFYSIADFGISNASAIAVDFTKGYKDMKVVKINKDFTVDKDQASDNNIQIKKTYDENEKQYFYDIYASPGKHADVELAECLILGKTGKITGAGMAGGGPNGVPLTSIYVGEKKSSDIDAIRLRLCFDLSNNPFTIERKFTEE